MIVAEVLMHRGRLPSGRFLSMGETLTRNSPVARMLMTEESIESEMMTGTFKGLEFVQFRTGEIIPEESIPLVGNYMGTAGGYHFFEKANG